MKRLVASALALLVSTVPYVAPPRAAAQLPRDPLDRQQEQDRQDRQDQLDRRDRTQERAAELSLPDPYLDPAWPDEHAEEMGSRYGEGRSDSVEDLPLDEEVEMQEEMRALEEILGTVPAPVVPVVPLAPVAGEALPGEVPLPAPPTHEVLDAPLPDDNDGGFEKDPVEW